MFDLIVVTAANEAQAKGYRAQLKGRKNSVVVPDPGNRRVGSLGATVNVLKGVLAGRGAPGGRALPKRNVLICHSGGDARRTPGYAAMGKAFVPMADGRPMLDHIVEAMEKLPAKDGVTVCCGDVIPYLDSGKVAFAKAGVTGVAYPDGPWQAQRHGVYAVANEECRMRNEELEAAGDGMPLAVSDFLQKPQVKRGRFLIDTGILHFDWATAAKMTKLPIAGDIYEEFPKLLLDGFASFAVSVVPSCRFFHIGSNRELLKLLGENGKVVDGVEGNELSLAGDNIVTNVPAEYGKIRLAKGECLTALPLGKDKWFYLKYKLDDNFKSDGKWEKYALGAKMRKVDHDRLVALRGAAVMGFREAAEAARPEFLEPIMKLEISVPPESVGEVLGDLNGRRGTVLDMTQRDDLQVVHALVPLAHLFGYSTAIRSLTRGRASYAMEPASFALVPANVRAQILER